jgi:hypothetical protein
MADKKGLQGLLLPVGKAKNARFVLAADKKVDARPLLKK